MPRGVPKTQKLAPSSTSSKGHKGAKAASAALVPEVLPAQVAKGSQQALAASHQETPLWADAQGQEDLIKVTMSLVSKNVTARLHQAVHAQKAAEATVAQAEKTRDALLKQGPLGDLARDVDDFLKASEALGWRRYVTYTRELAHKSPNCYTVTARITHTPSDNYGGEATSRTYAFTDELRKAQHACDEAEAALAAAAARTADIQLEQKRLGATKEELATKMAAMRLANRADARSATQAMAAILAQIGYADLADSGAETMRQLCKPGA